MYMIYPYARWRKKYLDSALSRADDGVRSAEEVPRSPVYEKGHGMEMFLSVADASRILGVTPQTVRLMIRRGDLLVTARTEGGIHLFRRGDVEQLAEKRAAKAASFSASEPGIAVAIPDSMTAA